MSRQNAVRQPLAPPKGVRPGGRAPLEFQSPHTQRLPELDALRGIMLLGMTLTHLPTLASQYAYQPLGFVGWAEGFVLVSALLAGKVYGSQLERRPFPVFLKRVLLRSARLYGYHLALLAVAFTVVAAVAVRSQEPALLGLLDFYLAHRGLAIISSLLLLYCPPLLDILPIYIAFLLVTPVILYEGRRGKWKYIVAASVLLWLAAQFGLRELIYTLVLERIGFPIPLQNLGAFNLYAWQLLWVFGLWVGSGGAPAFMKWVKSRSTIVVALMVAVTFFLVRFQIAPQSLIALADRGNTWLLFDKWQLGILRLSDFAAFAALFTIVLPKIARWLAWRPLVVLGQSSLEVFCLHVLFCFAAFSLVGDGTTAPISYQVAILVATLSGLFTLAYLRTTSRPLTATGVRLVFSK